jgi:alkylated DNA repair protein (DNA oxidative demethylase)
MTMARESEAIAVGPGARLHPGRLDPAAQRALVEELRAVVAAAPFFTPVTPRWGKPFSVAMTNCGRLGWVSDRRGYRYQPDHPDTGRPWPAMPARLLALWDEVGGYPHPPEACLVNFYRAEAKMGLHQDRDEADVSAPIVSVSLGDDCRFRLGGTERSDPTRSFPLASGDVLVLAGPSRLAFHGVDRILPGTSTLLSGGGRINLTLRRVTLPSV